LLTLSSPAGRWPRWPPPVEHALAVLVGGAREERRAAVKLEGLAIWTESLRDTIAGAVGLEQAIIATSAAAPAAIAAELAELADRLRVRVPLPQALHRLADELDDPVADLVVAALLLNARLRGPGLRQVLGSLADSTRAELEMRGRVTAGRASTRRSVQIVVAVTVMFVLVLVLFNPAYVAPYTTPIGQLVLALVVGLFAPASSGCAAVRLRPAGPVPAGPRRARPGREAAVTGVLLAGAVAGAGLLTLVLLLQRPATRGAGAGLGLAGWTPTGRGCGRTGACGPISARVDQVSRRRSARSAGSCASGWKLLGIRLPAGLRADLSRRRGMGGSCAVAA